MVAYYHLERYGIAREGLQSLLASNNRYWLAGSSADATEFLERLPGLSVRILLLDMDVARNKSFPINQCLQLCKFVQEQQPGISIVLHSPYDYAGWINRFRDAGVMGFVSKKSGVQELLNCFDQIIEGRLFICPELATQFANGDTFLHDNTIKLKPVLGGFTSRELEVLALISSGFTSNQISAKLNLATKTVETHRKNLLRKANARNSSELVAFATQRGIIVL